VSPLFKVDPNTGIVRTARSLVNSLKKDHELQISATSSGTNANGQINVTITSKADKAPVFKNKPYKVTVPENMGSVPNLKCIAAVDSNAKPVIYRISSGADNIFGLDANSGKTYARSHYSYALSTSSFFKVCKRICIVNFFFFWLGVLLCKCFRIVNLSKISTPTSHGYFFLRHGLKLVGRRFHKSFKDLDKDFRIQISEYSRD